MKRPSKTFSAAAALLALGACAGNSTTDSTNPARGVTAQSFTEQAQVVVFDVDGMT